MNYEKLTLDRFKLGLKEGKYETLTGARRAIGKTTSWTAKERETAQELANKHFGASATVKTAAKAGPKKAAKKTAAKASAAPKKTSVKKNGAAKHENGVGTTSPKPLVRTPQPESSGDYRVAAQDMLAFAANARREIEAHEQVIGSSEETKKNRQTLVGIVSNAIDHMNRAASGLPKPAAQTQAEAPAPRIEVPKTTKVAPPAPITQTELKTEAETVGEQKPVTDEDLTESEREAKRIFTQSGGGALGLPPPQS